MIGRPWSPPFGTLLVLGLSGMAVLHAVKLKPHQHIGSVIAAPLGEGEAQQHSTEDIIDAAPVEARLDPTLLERPLFAATRRPFVPPKPEPQSLPPEPKPEPKVVVAAPPPPPLEPPTPPQVEFRGTLVDDTGAWRALLSAPGGDGQWLKRGDAFEAWTVEEITRTQVRLTLEGFGHTVELMK